MVIVISILLVLFYALYRYSNVIFKKNYGSIAPRKLEITQELNQLFSDLKKEKLSFKIVPPEMMYAKAGGLYLKFVSALTAMALLCLLLDAIFHGTDCITKNSTQLINFSLAYAFFVYLFFGGMIASFSWKYYFFKYGLVSNNIEPIDRYITLQIKRILKNFYVLSIVSFILGTIFLKSGYVFFTGATILFGLFICFYSYAEFSRIGFVPILNFITETVDQFKVVKNVK